MIKKINNLNDALLEIDNVIIKDFKELNNSTIENVKSNIKMFFEKDYKFSSKYCNLFFENNIEEKTFIFSTKPIK